MNKRLIYKSMKALFILLAISVVACKTGQKTTKTNNMQNEFKPQFVPGPKAVIYKTKVNYNNFVPVALSDSKTEVVSFPAPSDLIINGELQTPLTLHDGYLLDRRGIWKNIAFIKMTYEEYSKLEKVPSPKELFSLIMDKDPLTELIDGGIKSAYTDPVSQINEMIDSKKLRTVCKVIK
jgi:hypothetical protein